MLFNDNTYFQYKFPEPQYLGAKYIWLGWINKFIPKNINIALDAFAGSQSVAYLFKQLNFTTYTNDFLNFNHQIGISLIENNNISFTDDDFNFIITNSTKNPENYNLIRNTYTNIFFEEEQAAFLDKVRANIELLSNKYKKALALTLVNRSLTRKVTMGHFAHTQAINYANNPERVKRNPNLARHIKDIMKDLIPIYNQAIFNNGKENISYNENIIELLPKLGNIDLVYIDPPYCDSHADYQSFYHLLETYTEYWKDKFFINNIKRYEPKKFSGFDKKQDIIDSLNKLFTLSKDIPNWLISWNNRSYPNIKELEKIVREYKSVQIETQTYLNGRGGKGSVAGSSEILFVCKNNLSINIGFKMKESFKDFQYWKEKYESDNLEEFNLNESGLLWLKIKSITRKELINEFVNKYEIKISSKTLNEQFQELYNSFSKNILLEKEKLESFIKEKNNEELNNIKKEELVSELYKMRHFDWGGDYKNALDRYLVDKYVKVFKRYDELISKFDTEINRAVQGYILCSWYNHWSSILIEYIFKSHPIVLPTIGQIKKVDFFINNIPFDLKVTYLPANYIETKRKGKGLKPELTELKQKAKQALISYSYHSKSDDIYYEIVEKMKSRNDEFCINALNEIKKTRIDILNESIAKPKTLVQNLYEEQGEMRFDSSNRLFLVLVDTDDFDNSWKLKRNLDLLTPKIMNYLDNFSNKSIEDMKINFHYKNRLNNYSAISDIIFIIK
jgi:adenine-specific DNA-methyltransferase